jgi:endogenous inhibitor of DNA gyrase (YacG/DUF329 family)
MDLPCPICHKSTEWTDNPFRPFCSNRCRLTDLGNWAAEKYRIKAEQKTEQQESQNPTDAEIHHGQEN